MGKVYPKPNQKIVPHKYQGQILSADERFLGIFAGIQGGKTFTGPIWLWDEICKYPEDDYMIIGPTFKILDRKAVPTFLEYLDYQKAQPGNNFEWRHKQNKGEIHLTTGAIVYLGSADNPDSIEAVTARAIWADEPGQMKRQAWVAMLGRVSETGGRILLTTTPYLKNTQNWLYSEVFKIWEEGDPDFKIVRFPSIANPSFSREEWERQKRLLDSDTFDIRYKAMFKRRGGTVYKEFDPDRMIVKPVEIPEHWLKLAGIDWGHNHPFAMTFWALSSDDVLYNYAEYWKKGGNFDLHASNIAEIAGDDEILAFYDPSRPDSARELENSLVKFGCYNISLNKADNDVFNGIMFVKSLFHQDKIRIFKGNKHLIEELENYSWEASKEGKDYSDKPIKKNDDCVDTLRYMAFNGVRKRYEPKITILGAQVA